MHKNATALAAALLLPTAAVAEPLGIFENYLLGLATVVSFVAFFALAALVVSKIRGKAAEYTPEVEAVIKTAAVISALGWVAFAIRFPDLLIREVVPALVGCCIGACVAAFLVWRQQKREDSAS